MSETTAPTRDDPLPPELQPGYRPNLPIQLGGSVMSPTQLPPELGGTMVPARATPDTRPRGYADQNYTVTGSGPGTWWQQQHSLPNQRPLDQPVQLPLPSQAPTQATPSPEALNRPPAFAVGHQPGPWPAAFPNSPRYDPAQAPALPGETPDETAALNRFMAHESNGQNIINNDAARNPRLYTEEHRTCSGYWQMVNSTWTNGARMAGVDVRQYPTAMSAPYQVQRQVALALYRAVGDQPWRGSVAGQRQNQNVNAMNAPQQYVPAQPRGSEDWGHPPPISGGTPPPGTSGIMQAGGMPQLGMPQQSDFGRIMGGLAPILLGIASLALRLPLSTAITAYGAATRAQQNGQREEYERNRTLQQDKLKEATAQQTLESRAASDAFSEYGHNNPEGLQQRLLQIALENNDPVMYRMAERGDLNGIYQMQQKRDALNQDLIKLHKAQDDEQQRQDRNAAVAAKDRQWDQENPNATPDQRAIAHAQHVGEVDRSMQGTGAGAGVESGIYNVVDPSGKVLRQVQQDKDGRLRDMQGNPAPSPEPGEQLVKVGTKAEGEGTGQPKSSDYKDYEWEDADDGKTHHGSAAIVPGKGLVDPQGNPINAKPGTINAVGTKAANSGAGKPYDIFDTNSGQKVSGPWELRFDPDGTPHRIDGGQLEFDPNTQHVVPSVTGRGGQPRFGSIDDLMSRWREQFVKDNGREPTTEEIAHQRQSFTQETKPPPMSSRQVSQRLGIAIGEAAGGVAALTQLSSHATLGPWGGAQAALSTNSYGNFIKSLTNRVTPEQAQMMNSIAKVIARPLASLEAAGVATGLVGVTQSLQTEFPQAGDSGYTVLTKLANIRNIIDAAEDMLSRDKNLDPEIKKLIAENRGKVDEAIPYTLNEVVSAQVNPTKENMRGLAERLLHRSGTQAQPQPGDVHDGYRFKGGNPADPNNWEKQ